MKSLKFLNCNKIDKNIIDEFINSKWSLIVSDYQSNKTGFVRVKMMIKNNSLETPSSLKRLRSVVVYKMVLKTIHIQCMMHPSHQHTDKLWTIF